MIVKRQKVDKSNITITNKIKTHSLLFMFCMTIFYMDEAKAKTKAKTEIRLMKPQSGVEASYSYYKSLIELALSKINKRHEYIIKSASVVLSQGRVLEELSKKEGLINIYQSGTTIEREKKFLVIRVPLLKGSSGYRIPIIHRDNLEKFKKIKSIQDLQKFTACQGAHWLDSDILEDANLPVIRNFSYRGMLTQTAKKYCDYFPRAIIEAYSDVLALRKSKHHLQVYEGVIISYPFPMYFFVSPYQRQLAEDIEKGLKLAIADGSFDRYFERNAIANYLFPSKKWKNSIKIRIPNKYLPRNTPLNDPNLWLAL